MKPNKRGRPNKLKAQIHTAIRLSQEHLDIIKKLGGGNVSQGIREMIARLATCQKEND